MENLSPLILEISSDEEAGFGDSGKGNGCDVGAGGELGDGEDCDWLSRLLGEVGGNIDDDTDDVVLVSEVFPKTPKKSRLESLKPLAKIVGDEGGDDDCVVLDGDPDKPAVVVNSRADVDDDSDDLEIVGEKGEVACRDFPHPRHLCAKFLFASTTHESHCSQCHCYVCDSPAPCPYWGTGISSIGHCHASDKEDYWKAERKRVKKADKPVLGISTTSGTSLLEAFFPTNQGPALSQPRSNSLAQNQGFNPVTTHPCSMPSNVGVPNAVNQVRTHPSGYVVPRCRSRSQLVSPQSHPTSYNNVAPRGRSHHLGSRNPQSFPPRAVFKRPGLVGASPNNRYAYGSHLSRDPSLQRYPALYSSLAEGRCSNQQNVGSHNANSVIPQSRLSSPHSLNVSRRPNYLPSQTWTHSQPYSSFLNPDPHQYQSQLPAQPCMNGDFLSPAPLQASVSSQPSVKSINNLVPPLPHVFQPTNPALSHAVSSYQSDAGSAFGNQFYSGSMGSTPPNAGNNFENHSSQPQAHNKPTLSIDGQNDVQQENHTQNGIDASAADFGFFRDPCLDNGNMQTHAEESQYQSTAPGETSQLQNMPKNGHHPSIAPLDNIARQNVVLADHTCPVNDTDFQLPEGRGAEPLGFQFGSWMFENQSLTEGVEVSVSPNWNVLSPEPTFIDAGTLFEI